MRSLPISAAGVAVIVDAMPARRRGVVATVITLLLTIPTLPWMLEARHAQNSYLRRAGEWIRQNTEGSPRIMTSRRRVVYYAAGEYVPLIVGTPKTRLPALFAERSPDWLVLE